MKQLIKKILISGVCIAVFCGFAGCALTKYKNVNATIKTDKGEIEYQSEVQKGRSREK